MTFSEKLETMTIDELHELHEMYASKNESTLCNLYKRKDINDELITRAFNALRDLAEYSVDVK